MHDATSTTTPAPNTVGAVEAELTALESDARMEASRLRANSELTDEGREAAFQRAAARNDWTGKTDRALGRLERAMTGAQAEADKVRGELVALPTGNAALAAELRSGRKARRIESAVNSDGSAAITEMVRTAEPDDLGVLLDSISDHAQSIGGRRGEAIEAVAEQALKDRDEYYKHVSARAAQARSVGVLVHARSEHLRRVVSDVNTPALSKHSLAGMSVRVGSESLLGLKA